MCERGRALSVFATIYLLCFSGLQDTLEYRYIAKTIVRRQKNIAISTSHVRIGLNAPAAWGRAGQGRLGTAGVFKEEVHVPGRKF
mgnify:CR=1 FL=1